MSYGWLALKWSEPYLVVQHIFSRSKTQEKHLSGTLWTSPSIQEVWSHCKRDDPWTWREESQLQPGARGLSSSTCQIQYYPAVSCMPQGCVQKHRLSVTGISSNCRQHVVFVPLLSFEHLHQSTNPKSLPPLRPGSGVCVGMTIESNESNEVYSGDSPWIVVGPKAKSKKQKSYLEPRTVVPHRMSHGGTSTSNANTSWACLCLTYKTYGYRSCDKLWKSKMPSASSEGLWGKVTLVTMIPHKTEDRHHDWSICKSLDNCIIRLTI